MVAFTFVSKPNTCISYQPWHQTSKFHIYISLYMYVHECVFPFHSHRHKAQSEDFPIEHNINATGQHNLLHID